MKTSTAARTDTHKGTQDNQSIAKVRISVAEKTRIFCHSITINAVGGYIDSYKAQKQAKTKNRSSPETNACHHGNHRPCLKARGGREEGWLKPRVSPLVTKPPASPSLFASEAPNPNTIRSLPSIDPSSTLKMKTFLFCLPCHKTHCCCCLLLVETFPQSVSPLRPPLKYPKRHACGGNNTLPKRKEPMKKKRRDERGSQAWLAHLAALTPDEEVELL